MPSPAAVANDGAAAAAAAAAQPAVSHTTTATTAIATNTMNGLSAATWPTASPPPGTPHVLSIVVGNTHLHWAMHTGPELDFHPTIFWRTSTPPSPSSPSSLVDSSPQKKVLPTLSHYIPADVKEELFGASGDVTAKAAALHRVQQRLPALSVYVISTNPTHANALAKLFEGLPVLLYKLAASDFLLVSKPPPPPPPSSSLSPSVPTATTTTTPNNNALNNNNNNNTITYYSCYQGMGVDRVACIAAAQYLYPDAHGCVLVIDGGTALTYTAASAASASATAAAAAAAAVVVVQQQQQQLGGGIGAGLNMKFRSLFDYTSDLPFIQPAMLREVVKECTALQRPLSLFATTTTTTTSAAKVSAHNNNNNNQTTTTTGMDLVQTSLMGSVLTETALLLCSVVRVWLQNNAHYEQPQLQTTKTATAAASDDALPTTTTTNDKNNSRNHLHLPTVVITGGDGDIYEKLLQPKHSYICETNEANAALLEAGLSSRVEPLDEHVAADEDGVTRTITASSDKGFLFRLRKHKFLPHHGIQHVLVANKIRSMDDDDKNNSDEVVRYELVGQRVAVQDPLARNNNNKKQAAAAVVYGTIVAVIRGATLDEDFYTVFYDDSGKIDDLKITVIHAALLMYAQSGEKLKSRDEQIKLRLAIKVMDAKNAAAVLESKSPAVQALVESRKPPPPKAPVAAAAPPPPPEGAGGESPPPAKKRKTSEAAKPPPPPPVDPNSYVGKRLAKHFEIDSEDGGAALVPFFGVITEYVEGEKWWHVVYDDDDNEDLFEEELLECFALYEKTKSGDLRGNLV